MIAVDDEFFVLIRLSTTGVSVLLSDSAAGLDYDIAADVLDLLRVDPPDEDDFELWPAGDLAIVHDLGMPEFELEVIVSDIDLYPDDQLESIANRCGFGEQWNEALMAKPQRVP
jgi:putative tRNA adenosine deaminase-associated protein